MAQLDVIIFTGTSGREYSLRVYPWKHRFKPLAAVYVVTERSIESRSIPTYSPIYVGITDDLSQLFSAHAKGECFEMYYANTVAVLPEADAAKRKQIEQDLLAALELPCNEAESC
jgi:hypothetical protein